MAELVALLGILEQTSKFSQKAVIHSDRHCVYFSVVLFGWYCCFVNIITFCVQKLVWYIVL